MTARAATPSIRPARDDDGDAIAALIADCFAEYPGCIFDRTAEFPELAGIARHFRAQNGAMWVAELAGKVVGCLAVRPIDGPAVELLKVYVGAAVRGSGLARRLLDLAEGFAAARDIKRLELWTDTRFTRAHRFYEKHGFVATGARRFLGDLSASWEWHYVRDAEG